MISPTLITGLQWGDEGKGKFVDYLGAKHDVTVRFNGGHNAGHTVKAQGHTLHLSLIPSSVLHGKQVLISQAVVINPAILLSEIKNLNSLGHQPNLGIDPRCQIVMPYHQLMDQASENYKGKTKTGSLGLGIGFCYADRTNRAGLRLVDLTSKTFLRSHVKKSWDLTLRQITKAYGYPAKLDQTAVINRFYRYGQQLKPYFLPVAEFVQSRLSSHSFLFESAQGFYLDFVFGSYPYTVAYHTLASSALPDIGLPAMPLKVIGLLKAYTTRVGNGPFPTESTTRPGQHLQTVGHEFGTVSGRPRRCGWLDLVLTQHAITMSGVSALALTKLDVLTGLSTIRVATAYRYQGRLITSPPTDLSALSKCTPVYRTFPGWSTDISRVKSISALPQTCRSYLRFIAKFTKIPIKYVSVGPDRSQTIINNRSFFSSERPRVSRTFELTNK